jgi:vesicle-associated membrane protein 7
MCMSDNKYPQDTAFAFLEDIKGIFLNTFLQGAIDSAFSYSLNNQFKDTLKGKMEYYNKHADQPVDSIGKLKKGLLDTKVVLMDAADELSVRGEKVNLIVKKAETLRQESTSYYDSVYFILF